MLQNNHIKPETSKAPWTAEEVANLNEYQQQNYFHPYTCVNHANADHTENDGKLIATEDGWICPSCDYKQDWASGGMVSGELTKMGLAMKDRLFRP